jgi:hypothetical protein
MEKTLTRPTAPYRQHLSSYEDLITPYEEIRAGFVALALEKNRRATPTVEQARTLKAAASNAPNPAALLSIPGIQAALLTAAGLSDKAAGHMRPQDKTEAIQGLIDNFLEPAGKAFVEELVFRFLLTRGDALGGSMRNLGGVLAQRKLTGVIIATLELAGTSYQWLHRATRAWLPSPAEPEVTGLAWSNAHGTRTILYDRTAPLVNKNIDFALFDASPDQLTRESQRNPRLYLALGELKGGIDPAGADEHWKTARSSLERIREAFSAQGASPCTFAVLAAIVRNMAQEIWNQLERGTLTNAANLTDSGQVASLCRWLAQL